jgi:uncharacterized membrane protein
MLQGALRLVVAGDALFACYLVSTGALALRMTPGDMRRRSSYEDEGLILIVLLTLGAVTLSLGAIFALVNAPELRGPLPIGLTVACVPLGWLMLHTLLAFHYAHLYYAKQADGGGRGDAGGLAFPQTEEPTTWDFLYFSFVVGMTAQVSDVQVLSTPMRRLTLAHGVAAFFFNTVLLALAVNVAASYAR